jgi:hypothetical protein
VKYVAMRQARSSIRGRRGSFLLNGGTGGWMIRLTAIVQPRGSIARGQRSRAAPVISSVTPGVPLGWNSSSTFGATSPMRAAKIPTRTTAE